MALRSRQIGHNFIAIAGMYLTYQGGCAIAEAAASNQIF